MKKIIYALILIAVVFIGSKNSVQAGQKNPLALTDKIESGSITYQKVVDISTGIVCISARVGNTSGPLSISCVK